jgi:hypothetical protein
MSDYVEIEVGDDDASDEALLGQEEEVIADEENRKELIEYLCTEYEEEEASREGRKEEWALWRKMAEAEPMVKTKNTPYRNASNVTPPLTQSIFHTAYAHLKQMFDARNPFWTVRASRKDDQEDVKRAKVLTKYLDVLARSESDLHLEAVKQQSLSDAALMGTVFMKVPWVAESTNYKRRDSTGNLVEETIYKRFGPQIQVAPLDRVVYSPEFSAIRDMPWVGYTITLPKHELANRGMNGTYVNVDEVMQWGDTSKDALDRQRDEARGSEQKAYADQFDITEFFVQWDVDQDGMYEDIIITLHVPSRTLLDIRFNDLLERDIVEAKFIARNYMVEGRGIGQMTKSMQLEAEGMHNVRNDNAKFAAMRMIAMNRATARENRESIYPGKIWKTENPHQDIVPIQLGEVYPSSFQAEQQAMMLARETTGISSVMGGFSDPRLGSRDTFRGQNMRMQQGQGVFASITTGLKSAFRQVGRLVYYQLCLHRDEVIAREQKAMRLSQEEIDILSEALSIPIQDIPIRMSFDISTTDIDQTFESKRQNMLTLTQLYSQWAQEVTPIAQLLFGPEGQQMQQAAPEMYKHFLDVYVGSTSMLHRIFEFFNEDDVDEYVPDIERYKALQEILHLGDQEIVKQKKQMIAMMRAAEEQGGMPQPATQGGFEPQQTMFGEGAMM